MKLKLIKKQDEAKGTKSFFFEPENPVSYLPGQYYYLTLEKMNYPDERGTTRHFTISSSPTEGNLLRITTRIRPESGFKKTLDELSVGSSVIGEGPNGVFVLNDSDKGPHVFLAGGIGITPFRSIVKYAIDKNLQIPMHLIYSNSIPEEIAFRQELNEWVGSHPNFKADMTISKPEESSGKWEGLTGRIDEALLSKVLSPEEKSGATFWVSGPPAMVDAITELLPKVGIPEGHIRSEKFTGY